MTFKRHSKRLSRWNVQEILYRSAKQYETGRQTREERPSQPSSLMERISDEQKATGMRAGPQTGPRWMVALQSWLTSKWWWFQGVCEFGLPFQSLDSLGIIYPFPSSFVSFHPVMVEANNIHLIKMYCGRRCWYCDHISCDGTSNARCSKRKEEMAERRGERGVDHSQEMTRRKGIEVRTFFQGFTGGGSL